MRGSDPIQNKYTATSQLSTSIMEVSYLEANSGNFRGKCAGNPEITVQNLKMQDKRMKGFHFPIQV